MEDLHDNGQEPLRQMTDMAAPLEQNGLVLRDELRPSSLSLSSLLAGLPRANRPGFTTAIQFIHDNGGQVQEIEGDCYVLGESAGLINYNFGREDVKPQRLGRGWLNREQLAAVTDQEIQQVDADLRSVNWRDVRRRLANIRIPPVSGERVHSRSRVHVLWAIPEGSRIILPHYNPAIVTRVATMAKERHTAANAIKSAAKAAGALAMGDVSPKKRAKKMLTTVGEQTPGLYQTISDWPAVTDRSALLDALRARPVDPNDA